MTDPNTKVELFVAVTVEEALERGANFPSGRGDLTECSFSNET